MKLGIVIILLIFICGCAAHTPIDKIVFCNDRMMVIYKDVK